MLDGLRAGLPDVDVTHVAGDDPSDVTSIAGQSDVAVVVVGYTYLDEGEFIGGDATRHLTELLPGPDDPELVAAFQAEVASRPAVEPPSHVAARGAGFATGGDRTSLRLSDAHVELIRTSRRPTHAPWWRSWQAARW